MTRFAFLVLVLTLGIAIQLTNATEVLINNIDNKLCMYANLMVNFSVTYEVAGNKSLTANFGLPENVTTGGSSCNDTKSTLKLSFGKGHSWTIMFTNDNKTYQADSIVFAYNLSDSSIFNKALSNETMSVNLKPTIKDVVIDTCYSCKSADRLVAQDVTLTLWQVLIQAFVNNGSKSENITSCAADVPSTTAPPPTTPHTSSVPPATTTTTPPTPTLPPPTTGKYMVKREENATACLLASFGLRVGFKQGEKYHEMNLEPNGTHASGSCGNSSSDLVLSSNSITIMFTFTSDAKKFQLHAMNVTISSGVPFTDANNNLSLWQAAVSSSYMCNKQQVFNITSLLTLYTFDLRVQPFEVNKGEFSTAHECSMDDTSILIPIIVGAALAGLILIVLIAYVIGRRKTYVGYQTL